MDEDSAAPPAGTRFTVDLDSDSEAGPPRSFLSNGLIADISERTASSPALAPTLDASKNSGGFPLHKKRKRPSAFRQQRAAASSPAPAPAPAPTAGERSAAHPSSAQGNSRNVGPPDEMASIRAENAKRLAAMSSKDVELEREELMDSLSPELLQMFLKRASLDDVVDTSRPVKLEEAAAASTSEIIQKQPESAAEKSQTPPPPAHLKDIPESAFPPSIKVHFPQPPPASESDPDPDPSSPEFLAHLHKKYFPDLPADPQKLAWMRPTSGSEPDPHYSPKLTSVLPSAVRFDFKGRLLPPRKAREIPANLGLHHHADSPLSAGYTIPELAHLARSSFPAQRCMAFQTLGRVLYRLGSKAYSRPGGAGGDEGETNDGTSRETSRNTGTDLEKGLWRCIHEGRVIETLQDSATGGKNAEGSSHLGVKNYALEALWLWQKGGGETWKAD